MLDSVKVPCEFESIFEKAQELVKSYFNERCHYPSKGIIEISGERYIMLRAASMSVDFFDTIIEIYRDSWEKEALNIARNLLFDLAHSIGKSDAKNLHRKMNLEDPVEKLSAGPIHFAHSGWAFVEISPDSRLSCDENFFILYDHPCSFESNAWIKTGKSTDHPVCIMNAGYSSGWCEASFGIPLVAVEILCTAKGDDVCRFIMAHPSKIEGYIKKYIQKFPEIAKKVKRYKIPGLFERKKQELVLNDVTNKAQEYLNIVGTMIIVINKEQKVTLINKKGCELLGFREEEVIDKNWIENFVPEGEKVKVETIFNGLLRGDTSDSSQMDYAVLTKSGSEKIITWNNTVIRDGYGNITGTLSSGEDITEKRQIEEENRRLLITNQRKLQKMNCLLTICKIADIQDATLEDTIHKVVRTIPSAWLNSDKIRARIIIEELIFTSDDFCETEHKLTFPFTIQKKTLGKLEIFFKDKEYENIVSLEEESLFLEVLADRIRRITERMLIEKALKDSEEKLRQITEAAHDAIIMMNNEGKISFWNSAAEHMFGYSREEIIGRNLHYMLAPSRFHKTYDEAFPVWQTTGHGAAVGRTLELKALRKDGAEFPIELSLSNVMLDNKWNAIGIVRDITERKQIEEELKNAKEAADLANKAKSEFLANMSHEIRTPMNGVIGMTNLLMDTELTPHQREYLEMIRNSGEQLMGVINDILDFSKIEANRLELESVDFNIRDTIEDALDSLALRVQEKNLELICNIAQNVPFLLRGDPVRLRQILVNICGNAVKFTASGHIALTTTLEKEDATHVTLKFKISDTGIGIPADKIDRLFKSFSQLDSSTTRKFGGSGLGLAISKRLAELMGGTISVESQEGKGSTFWFTGIFEKQIEANQKQLYLSEDIKTLSVFVVDDNELNCKMLGEQLGNWEITHNEATDGITALNKLRSAHTEGRPFNIALIDHIMPVIDGLTLGRIIKNDIQLKDTKLILLTSGNIQGMEKEIKEIGFSEHLLKPIKRSRLYEILVRSSEGKIKKDEIKRADKTLIFTDESGQKLRILVAEDNITNQKLIEKILQNAGFQVSLASNGKEVIEALKLKPYDLILMDVQMPEMDGLETTRAIRFSEKITGTHIPIIALTAHAIKGDMERCIEAGMDGYLTKPINIKKLFTIIEKMLNIAGKKKYESLSGADKKRPFFDESVLSDFFDGDEGLAREIYKVFLLDVPVRIEKLDKAIKKGELAEAEMQAHTLKGSGGNIGAGAFREEAILIEKAVKMKDLSTAQVHCNNLKREFEKLKRILSQKLNELPVG